MEKPILFSGPMVKAILDGRKTQTRRVVKLNHAGRVKEIGGHRNWHLGDPECVNAAPWKPGDRLWVREAWRPLWDHECGVAMLGDCVQYRADMAKRKPAFPSEEAGFRFSDRCDANNDSPRWLSPMFMPRWASRITLLVKSVRVERLQEISEADAKAEGVTNKGYTTDDPIDEVICRGCGKHRDRHVCASNGNRYCFGGTGGLFSAASWCGGFRETWDSINAKKHPWASNPWVWVVEFVRAKGGGECGA